ncbi:MAG TPA: hypothetical protein VLH86_05075 [Patescibacteria group bacterium]|nr:hypothetical protein [Patescibacteria group bacterium]
MSGDGINTQLKTFLGATWQSPVFGDTFPGEDNSQRLAWAEAQLGAIAKAVAAELAGIIAEGMPELSQDEVQHIVKTEIIPKTLAFCPALTIGEIDDIPRLSAVSTAVCVMYWGDQTMDRGDTTMAEAIALLGKKKPGTVSKLAQARFQGLQHIQAKIEELAKPEDTALVTDCFYGQVLHNEEVMHQLSLAYLKTGKDQAFLQEHSTQLAEISTVSAGFPSISSSLYAIYRQHDASLLPLSAIYGNTAMTNLLQTCNVVVRLWDELGDWEMDSGYDPSKGQFVINPFNQYDPAIVQRFCELAFIIKPTEVAALQQAFSEFHTSDATRHQHGAYILDALRTHIRQYMAATIADLPPADYKAFERYIILCKRVLEIGYVNRIGDIALATPDRSTL